MLLRILRILAIAVFLVACLMVASVLFLTSPAGGKYIKDKIEKQIYARYNIELSIGTLQTDLISQIHARQISVTRPHTSQPFLTITDFIIRYDLLKLLHREIAFTAIDLDGVEVSASRDSSGRFDIAFLNPAARRSANQRKPSFKLLLGSVSLKNLSADYHDARLHADARIRDLSADATRSTEGFQISFAANSIDGMYDNLPILVRRLSTYGQWTHGEWDIASFKCELDSVDLSANAQIGIGAATSLRGNLVATGAANFLLGALSEKYNFQSMTTQGNVELHADVSGSIRDPIVDMQLLLPVSNYANLQVQGGQLNARLRGDTITVDSLNLQMLDGMVQANGQLSLDSLFESRLNLSITNIDLALLWDSFNEGESPYSGTLNGKIILHGRGKKIKDWSLESDIRANSMMYRSQSLPDFYSSLSLSNGLGRFQARESYFNIEANARLKEHNLEGDFVFDIDKIDPLVGLFNVSEAEGAIYGSGTLSGTLESPQILAEISGRDIQYQNFPVDTVEARFRFQDRQLTILESSFSGKVDSIDQRDTPFHIKSLSGGYKYTGHASGSIDSIQSNVDIDLMQPKYEAYALDSARLAIVTDGYDISIVSSKLFKDSLVTEIQADFSLSTRHGTLRSSLYDYSANTPSHADSIYNKSAKSHGIRPAGVITSEFDLSNTQDLSVKVSLRGIDLHSISGLLSDSIDIAGKLQSDIDFSGSIAQPQIRLNATIIQPRYRGVTLDSMDVTIALDNNLLQVSELELFNGDQRFKADGSLGLAKGSRGQYIMSKRSSTTGTMSWRNLDVSIFKLIIPGKMELGGQTSGNLAWKGTLQSSHPRGRIILTNALVRFDPNNDPIRQIDASITIQDSLARIDSISGNVRQTPFTLSGTVVTSAFRQIQLDLKFTVSTLSGGTATGTLARDYLNMEARISQFDLSLVQPFLRSIKSLSGMFDCSVKISGSLSDPKILGSMAIHQLSFQPAWVDNTFENGTVDVHFDKDQFFLDSLSINSNGGTMTAHGTLARNRNVIANINLDVSINDITVNRSKEFTANLKAASISCRRKEDYFLLAGDVQFGESRLTAGFRPQSILPWTQKVEQPASELPEFLQQFRLDVRIHGGDKMWVDNNLAHIRLSSELEVIGSPELPNLSGRIKVEEGYLIYLDRKFNITQGEIYFVNPDKINPDIDLKAQATVTDYAGTSSTQYTISLEIEGPLDQVVVTLTSQPALDNSDIIALLTFGETRSELIGAGTAGGGRLRNVLVERAEALSSQKISGFVSRKIETILGLEQVTVQGDLFNINGPAGPQLLASKRITKRAELTYSTTVGYINDQSIRLDYLLSKHFSVEGQTDQVGRANISFKYTLRFK
jgi:autotransporter translocation and assembly factor TamB